MLVLAELDNLYRLLIRTPSVLVSNRNGVIVIDPGRRPNYETAEQARRARDFTRADILFWGAWAETVRRLASYNAKAYANYQFKKLADVLNYPYITLKIRGVQLPAGHCIDISTATLSWILEDILE